MRTHASSKDFRCPYCSKEFVMHSYLQRHIRTHGSTAAAAGAADGVSVKASVGGVTTTTTLLSPITLESSGHQGSLIVSQPALNIPPNTSQNYFMIQTSSGLQLIPLSSPAPPPPQPPPPPPPSQPQNFYLLQCPSSGGAQSNLILVPTANSTNAAAPAQDSQTLPVLQTFQALQSVLNQPQTHMTQFTTMPPPPPQQQQATRIIITNNNQQAAPPAPTLSANSLLSKPILGRSTRTTRSRRGRKPKASLPKVAAFPCKKDATDRLQAPNGEAPPIATADITAASSPPASSFALSPHLSAKDSVSMMSSSASKIPSSADTSMTSAVVTEPVPPVSDTAAPECRAQEVLGDTQTGDTLSGDTLAGKQFVLCFDNQAREREELKLGEGGESYVLQFETDGREKEDKNKVGVMSLLHDWGEKKQTERQEEEDGGQAESYVLHFHTEASGGGDPATAGTFGQELDGREVVFELGDGAKMEQEAQEGVQMIALIEGREEEEEEEGGMMGGAAGAAGCGGAGEGVSEDRAGVEGIFQLGSGEEIVIIEVSTSSLRRGDSRGEVLHDGAEAEAKEKMAKGQRSAEDTEEGDSLAEDDQGPSCTQPRDAVL